VNRPILTCIARQIRFTILSATLALFAVTTAVGQQIDWKPASVGLEGGAVSAFAFDVASGNIYAGTECDLFRFDRESNRWTVEVPHLPADFLATTGSGALIVNSDSTLYRIASSGATPEPVAVPGRMTSMAMAPGGTIVAFTMPRYTIRSIDDGLTWEIIDSTFSHSYKGRNIIAGADGSFYSYGGDQRVTRSTDDGLTWDSLRGLTDKKIYSMISSEAGRTIALASNNNEIDSIYRSGDNGVSWTRAVHSIRFVSGWGIGRESILYAKSYAPGDAGEVLLYRSSDHGSSWTDVATVDRDAVLGVAPWGEVWIAQKGRIQSSADRGSKWEDRTEGFMALRVPQIMSDRTGRLYAIAGGRAAIGPARPNVANWLSWGTLYSSLDDGRSWSPLLTNTVKINGGIDNGMLYVGHLGTPGVTYSRDNGVTWDSIHSTSSSFGGVDDNASGKIVMTFVPSEGQPDLSEIAVSNDRGRTWSRTTRNGLWFSPLVLESGSILMRQFKDNRVDLMTSRDDGATWEIALPEISIRDIGVLPNGEIHLVGTPRNGNYSSYRSTDGGATWELRYEFLPAEANYGYLLLTRRGDILLKLENLRSRDGGRKWDSIGPSALISCDLVESPDGTFQAFTPAVAQWIIPYMPVRVESEIYRSTDRGDNWTRHDGPVPTHGTISLAVTPSGRTLVGTNGSGIYTDDGVSHVPASRTATLGLSIDAIGPNPLRGRMVTRISLAARQQVSLILSDPVGREVAVLHSGMVEAGSNDIAIDIPELPTGAYLLSLRSAGELVSRRVILLH
jgi:hypothetical protein